MIRSLIAHMAIASISDVEGGQRMRRMMVALTSISAWPRDHVQKGLLGYHSGNCP